MANYDFSAALRNTQRQQDTAYLTKLGAQQAAQNFIDSYMSPNELTDLYPRLGILVTQNTESTSVADYSFPPYNLSVTKTGLGVRAGGFRQLNNKINEIQLGLRNITGEIRTKITEWDISLYLQELWVTDTSMFDLSLLYRIFDDNPSKYTNTDALVYGIVNASINFEHRYSNYNPSADPDLTYWKPPTEDLLANQAIPRGHSETTKSGGLNLFGWKIFQKNRSVWVWDVAPPPVIDAWQQEQVRIATEGGWTSWYPQYWQLFFDSENPATIGEKDFGTIIDRLNSLAKKRRKVKAIPRVKPRADATTLTAPGETGSVLGLNLLSPIWYGYPYGRELDPRSVEGYFLNQLPNIPKIDITDTDRAQKINASYPYGNPMDGLNKLLNGWSSTYDIVTYEERTKTVYKAASGRRSGHTRTEEEDVDTQGTYTTELVIVEVVTEGTTTSTYPTATCRITTPSSDKRSIKKKIFQTTTKTTRGGRAEKVTTASWKKIDQTIDPSTTLQIDHFDGMNMDDPSALGGPGVAKPVILVGDIPPGGTMPAFVIIAPLEKVEAIVTSSRRVKFLWWSWNVSTSKSTWVYQLDMSKGQGFSINTGSNDVVVAVPHLPLQYFTNGAAVRGVYFSIPKRSFSPTSNIITDGWPGAGGMTSVHGSAIATALLNPMWFNGVVFNRAPLHRIFDELIKLYSPIAQTLDSFISLLSPASGNVILTLISTFSPDVQNKPAILGAKASFSDPVRGRTLAYVEYTKSVLATFVTALNNMVQSRGVYTYSDILAFYSNYKVVVGGLRSASLVSAIKDYLNVMYEQRKILLAKRLNKESGTLINSARAEFALALMQDSLSTVPTPTDTLIKSQLTVVHKVTTVSLMTKATGDVPDEERVRIVYVKVLYDANGAIVRPPAGTYKLYSQEILEQKSLVPAEWYITFEEGVAPNIVHDVITSLDGMKLQQIITNPNLTDLEKICYARTLEDWWEIKVPEVAQPLVDYYQTNLLLILNQPDDFIAAYLNITGTSADNPVVDSTTRLELGSTWITDPGMQETLARMNPEEEEVATTTEATPTPDQVTILPVAVETDAGVNGLLVADVSTTEMGTSVKAEI